MIYIYIYNEKEKNSEEKLKKQRQFAEKLLEKLLWEQFEKKLSDFEISKGEHGKPFFKNSNLHFNISHCDGGVCCAVGKKELGIDIERADRDALSIAKRVCSENELAELNKANDKKENFIKYFTLKESYVKYLGVGLSYGLKNAEFEFVKEKPVLKSCNLPFQQEKISCEKACYIVAACGEEMPMKIKIIKEI